MLAFHCCDPLYSLGVANEEWWRRHGSARAVTMMGVRFSQAAKNSSEEWRSSFSTLEFVENIGRGMNGNVAVRRKRPPEECRMYTAHRSFIYFQILPPYPPSFPFFLSPLFLSASTPRRNPVERPIFVKSDSPDDGGTGIPYQKEILAIFQSRVFDKSMYIVYRCA